MAKMFKMAKMTKIWLFFGHFLAKLVISCNPRRESGVFPAKSVKTAKSARFMPFCVIFDKNGHFSTHRERITCLFALFGHLARIARFEYTVVNVPLLVKPMPTNFSMPSCSRILTVFRHFRQN